ncbi:unnamed protein product [Microthlaspi erraticum]|uniref:F-box associated beta-propeller type 1 domain-containing protein n=1 Tax=Microthlaspi erraticum TaxID=1685480 RepID=A0A6D2JXC7_9BRAS|nr:unnamed protein product [Microthlaspi erraticum]
MNSKVCSLSFHHKKEEDSGLVDLSINQVDLLNQVEISHVFHCDGLLLCVAKDSSKLVVWNPYLYQTRCIVPTQRFPLYGMYALGYDMNRNHKILRFVDDIDCSGTRPTERITGCEIYEIRSNSWRVLEVTPDWETRNYGRGVSVKGNTYLFATERLCDEYGWVSEVKDFLLCFDFTRERFGPRLPIPFHSYEDQSVALSCVRDEQLAVMYCKDGGNDDICGSVEIWVTTRIEPESMSWSKFLRVEMRPFRITGVRVDQYRGSFFVDEEERVAVVFDLDSYHPPTRTTRYHTAFIHGEDGYLKSVSLGEAPCPGPRCPITGFIAEVYIPPLVCSSSYRPSLVQVKLT